MSLSEDHGELEGRPSGSADPRAYVTLDLEDNWDFEDEELRYQVFDHVERYVDRMSDLDVPVTVFVVGTVLEDRPDVVERLESGLDVEFHLHSYRHDMTGEAAIEREIRDGIRAFESVLGRRPAGYRAPRFIIDADDLTALDDAGFTFDSSICPSYRPGVYNNLGKPTEPYVPSVAPGLLEVPISVHPIVPVPFEQSYLRLLREPSIRVLRRSRLPDPLVFNSHLHDYFYTDAHDHLGPVRRRLFTSNIDRSWALFERFVDVLRERNYRFETMGDLVDRYWRNTPHIEGVH